jgi:hypothetical protein
MSKDIGDTQQERTPTNAVSAINAPAGVVIWGGLSEAMEALLSRLPMKKKSGEFGGPLAISDLMLDLARHGINVTRRASKAAQITEIINAVRPVRDFPIMNRTINIVTAATWARLGVFGEMPGQPMRLVKRDNWDTDAMAALAAFVTSNGSNAPEDVEDLQSINGQYQLQRMRGSAIKQREYATGSYSINGNNGTDSLKLLVDHVRYGCIKNDLLNYGEKAECVTDSGVPSWLPKGSIGAPCPTCGGDTVPMVRKDFSATASEHAMMPIYRTDSGRWNAHHGAAGMLRWVHIQNVKSGGRKVTRMKPNCAFDRAMSVKYGKEPGFNKTIALTGRLQRVIYNVWNHHDDSNFNVLGWALFIGDERGVNDPSWTEDSVCRALVRSMKSRLNHSDSEKVAEDIGQLALLMKSI